MKKNIILLLIVSVVGGVMVSCNSMQNKKYNQSEERQWWNSLNETWQIVFLREIDKIGKKPTDEDLIKILNLEQVTCDHFPLGETNLDPLRKLKRLKSISAGSCFIQNIDALAELDSITEVNVPDNHIESIEALKNHKMLEVLYIQITDVDDLSVLADKENLQLVVFASTKVKSIKPIMNLPKLSIVSFSEEIDKKEIEEFKSLHPDCDIN